MGWPCSSFSWNHRDCPCASLLFGVISLWWWGHILKKLAFSWRKRFWGQIPVYQNGKGMLVGNGITKHIVREMETKLQCPRPQNSPDTISERTRLAQSNVHPREAGQQPYCSLILWIQRISTVTARTRRPQCCVSGLGTVLNLHRKIPLQRRMALKRLLVKGRGAWRVILLRNLVQTLSRESLSLQRYAIPNISSWQPHTPSQTETIIYWHRTTVVWLSTQWIYYTELFTPQSARIWFSQSSLSSLSIM